IAKGTNSAFAVLRVGGLSSLYTVNLVTGAADLVGTIGTGAGVIRSLTVLPAYDLFDPKPSTDGPTPAVNSLVIDFRDLPNRTAAGRPVHADGERRHHRQGRQPSRWREQRHRAA